MGERRGNANKFKDEDEPQVETKKEIGPRRESIRAGFNEMIEGEYTVVRELEDKEGLYLWEVTIPDGDGIAEYTFIRKGEHPGIKARMSVINVVRYDETGMPMSGSLIADYINGAWKISK